MTHQFCKKNMWDGQKKTSILSIIANYYWFLIPLRVLPLFSSIFQQSFIYLSFGQYCIKNQTYLKICRDNSLQNHTIDSI